MPCVIRTLTILSQFMNGEKVIGARSRLVLKVLHSVIHTLKSILMNLSSFSTLSVICAIRCKHRNQPLVTCRPNQLVYGLGSVPSILDGNYGEKVSQRQSTQTGTKSVCFYGIIWASSIQHHLVKWFVVSVLFQTD